MITKMKAVERFGETPGGRRIETHSLRESGGRGQKRHTEKTGTRKGGSDGEAQDRDERQILTEMESAIGT